MCLINSDVDNKMITKFKEIFPEKFPSEEYIFRKIHPGDRLFIGTACGEPQFLVQALINYVGSHPTALFDTEVLQVFTLGLAPYTDVKFKDNFRHNSFFIGDNTRDAINSGMADYTPISLSEVPDLFRKKIVPIDVALIQTSPPDSHGYVSLGVSLDIVKAAVASARIVIAQINANMPRVHGDSFLSVNDIDFFLPHDEPLLEYQFQVSDNVAMRIGSHVSSIIEDGDTIQIGFGVNNATLASLRSKKHLGVHTELLTPGIIDLIKEGVIDNTKKTLYPGKTVATFCMGDRSTYEYINDNPLFEFRTVDYTNNPLVIAQNRNMTAINTALEIDLTGQATTENIGQTFYSGIGGLSDFIRGANLARGGKTILALRSTGGRTKFSKIVPSIKDGAGVTLSRNDVHYVVTENGIAYLHGKSIRERAMALITIAHPKFRPWLIEEAKRRNLIYKDQAFIPGDKGEYPGHLETIRTTKTYMTVLLRPVKISDEPIIKEFFYSLSDHTMYNRFFNAKRHMSHEQLQEYVVIDYSREMTILAVIHQYNKEVIVGMGQYFVDEREHTAELAFVVRDDYQNKGIAAELLSYLTVLAKKQGLLGFTAEVMLDNGSMMHLFEKSGFEIEHTIFTGSYAMKMSFTQNDKSVT